MGHNTIEVFNIPHVYPTTLEGCFEIIRNFKYASYGFPYVFMGYSLADNTWQWTFRNAAKFEIVHTEDIDPLISCHKFFDAIKKRVEKTQ